MTSHDDMKRAESIVEQYMSWDAAGFGACVDAELRIPEIDAKDAANAIAIFMREKVDRAISLGKPVQLAWIDANQVIKCADIVSAALQSPASDKQNSSGAYGFCASAPKKADEPTGNEGSPEHRTDAESGVVDVSFWVVEQFTDGKSNGYWDGGHSGSFTTDINKAVQFRRKDDAFWATRGRHWNDVRLTEHIMISATGHLRQPGEGK